ncbi:hypothetical protein THAOC_17393 [Thalassiosira oceanica]|uniref:Uncharacterized protein n=1 Tax=Thalassiosira oceanica TaxID=159749 RepID=K0SM55_THAOC|nr:hypothetical protein THAOC_17393 [Thalassiosira oceanica]|eukprot:EJK62016.1 hypothetical protein THAOC_17393 [Thalassiosira oceanica]
MLKVVRCVSYEQPRVRVRRLVFRWVYILFGQEAEAASEPVEVALCPEHTGQCSLEEGDGQSAPDLPQHSRTGTGERVDGYREIWEDRDRRDTNEIGQVSRIAGKEVVNDDIGPSRAVVVDLALHELEEVRLGFVLGRCAGCQSGRFDEPSEFRIVRVEERY